MRHLQGFDTAWYRLLSPYLYKFRTFSCMIWDCWLIWRYKFHDEEISDSNLLIIFHKIHFVDLDIHKEKHLARQKYFWENYTSNRLCNFLNSMPCLYLRNQIWFNMDVYILLNLLYTDNPILGVFDNELSDMKREQYCKISFPNYELKIVQHRVEYGYMD